MIQHIEKSTIMRSTPFFSKTSAMGRLIGRVKWGDLALTSGSLLYLVKAALSFMTGYWMIAGLDLVTGSGLAIMRSDYVKFTNLHRATRDISSRVRDLARENQTYYEQNTRHSKENDRQSKENDRLTGQVDRLSNEVIDFRTENKTLRSTSDRLRHVADRYHAENESLKQAVLGHVRNNKQQTSNNQVHERNNKKQGELLGQSAAILGQSHDVLAQVLAALSRGERIDEEILQKHFRKSKALVAKITKLEATQESNARKYLKTWQAMQQGIEQVTDHFGKAKQALEKSAAKFEQAAAEVAALKETREALQRDNENLQAQVMHLQRIKDRLERTAVSHTASAASLEVSATTLANGTERVGRLLKALEFLVTVKSLFHTEVKGTTFGVISLAALTGWVAKAYFPEMKLPLNPLSHAIGVKT